MITFATAEVAQRCIEMYNGQPFPGGDRPMTISIAKFKPMDPSARGGAGGGFRGGRGGGGGRGGFGKSICLVNCSLYKTLFEDGGFGGRGGGGDRGGFRGMFSYLFIFFSIFSCLFRRLTKSCTLSMCLRITCFK